MSNASSPFAGRRTIESLALRLLCAAAAAMILSPGYLPGAERDLLRVILPRKAQEPTRFAAAELARYLGKITGEDVPVVEEGTGFCIVAASDAEPVPEAVRARLKDRGPEAYVIESRPEGIFMVGNSPRAAVYACYRFLEKYLDCRWYTPDPAEEIVPRKSPAEVTALAQSDIGDLEEPDFSVRMWRYLVYDLGPAGTPLADEVMRRLEEIVAWMPKLRLNVLQFAMDHGWDCHTHWKAFRAVMPELRRRGLEAGMGGHCLHVFMGAKQFEQHPEWQPFDKSKDARWNAGQFCTRQPEAVEHYIDGLIAFLKANPQITYFAPWPHDGAGWCECSRCAETPVADRHLELGNRVYKRLRAAAPHVRYSHFAYGTHSALPTEEKPLPGLTVTLCTWGRDYGVPFDDPRTLERYRREFAQWRDACRVADGELVLHEKYARMLGTGLHLMPLPTLAEDLRFYRKQGVAGFELPCAYMGWWPKSLNWVALSKLIWDADADVEALTGDFFTRFYPPCAKQAAEIYALAEAAQPDYHYWVANKVRIGRNLKPGGDSAGLFPFAKRAAELLGQAHLKTRELRDRFEHDPALSYRLGHLETVLDYARCEFGAFREIARGADVAAEAEKIAEPAARQARLESAARHFESAARLDLRRRQFALRPEDYGLIWDLSGAGPLAVYQSKIIPAWLRVIAARKREKSLWQ